MVFARRRNRVLREALRDRYHIFSIRRHTHRGMAVHSICQMNIRIIIISSLCIFLFIAAFHERFPFQMNFSITESTFKKNASYTLMTLRNNNTDVISSIQDDIHRFNFTNYQSRINSHTQSVTETVKSDDFSNSPSQSSTSNEVSLPPWTNHSRTQFTDHVFEILRDLNPTGYQECHVHVKLHVQEPYSIPSFDMVCGSEACI
jgi:hypothetical protein